MTTLSVSDQTPAPVSSWRDLAATNPVRSGGASRRQDGDEAHRGEHGHHHEHRGTFVSAVFSAIASFTRPGDGPSPTAQPTGAVPAANAAQAASPVAPAGSVQIKEKVKLDVRIADNGDVQVEMQLRARARGDGVSASDLMQAMQSFASSLFGALRDLFGGATSQGGTTPTAPAQLSSATSSVAPTSATAPAPQPDTTLPSTDGATAGTTATAATPEAPASIPTTVSTAPTKLGIASYLSIETRARILAQHVEQAGAAPTGSTAVQALQQQFAQIMGTLQTGQSAPQPSLADFLRSLADDLAQPQSASFSLSLRGSFVSTAA